MKKIISVVVLSLLIAAPVFAEEVTKEAMPGMNTDRPMGMSNMGRKCFSMMGKAQMVATDEGGVIVLMGNKLTKYDADLNLVKEVEVKMPMGSRGGKQCSMMGKMMDPSAASAGEEPQEKAAA